MLSGALKTIFYPLISKSHTLIHVETRINRSVWNGQNVLLGISKDITDLRYSEQRLQIALKGGNNGLWDWDFVTGEYFLTSSAYEMLGYTNYEEKSTIEKWDELMHPDDVNPSKLRLFSHIDGETEYYETESRIKKADGSYKWILTRGKIIERDENDQATRMMGVVIDIDKLKAMEKELTAAKSDAERANISKSRFLANMSHEIRTPMTGIMGMTRLLQSTGLSNVQRDYLNAIHTSADNLLAIINDILDFSKINEGKLSLSPVDFRLDKLVRDTCTSLNNIAESKDIQLRHNIDSDINTVLYGDALRINQVILNLLGNAIKFTHVGHVDLNVKLEKKENESNFIKISVTDTGIGIEKDKHEEIFNIFSQEDESVSRKYGGTGLGLAISKQLVEMMGGTLAVQSEKGKGSEFFFTIALPDGNANNLIEDSIQTPKSMDLSDVRVLVAEDHKINQFLIRSLFQNWNIEPDIVDNGLMAVEMVKKNKYDIIFMDKQMPEMGGIKATRIIRFKLNITTPIIALTASALKNDRNLALNAGMNDYISKPFDPDDLLNKLLKFVKPGEQVPEFPEQNKPAEPPAALFNLQGLRKIFSKNEHKIKEMIELFLEQTPVQWKELLSQYNAANFKKVGEIAHKIKPTIDLLEITSLTEVIRDIELQAKNNNEEGTLDDSLEIFESIIDDVYEQLNEEIISLK